MQYLDQTEVIDFLLTFDIFSLNETFVAGDKCEYTMFKEYNMYAKGAKKLTKGGRNSGGVIVFVKKSLSLSVKRIEIKYDNIVVLEINKNFVGLEKNLLLICVYIHPYDSKYWNTELWLRIGISRTVHC